MLIVSELKFTFLPVLRTVIIPLLFFWLPCSAQPPKASVGELGWALVHPFAAFKVKKITKKCIAEVDEKLITSLLDSYNNGGKADAFRHCFFMAGYAQKIKPKKLRKLGKIHEKMNYKLFTRSKLEYGERSDSLGSVMDLFNNELGLKISAGNKKITLTQLRDLIVEEIKAGKAYIMKRNKTGNCLDCEGKEIDLNVYKKKWVVPKCLVRSDYVY